MTSHARARPRPRARAYIFDISALGQGVGPEHTFVPRTGDLPPARPNPSNGGLTRERVFVPQTGDLRANHSNEGLTAKSPERGIDTRRLNKGSGSGISHYPKAIGAMGASFRHPKHGRFSTPRLSPERVNRTRRDESPERGIAPAPVVADASGVNDWKGHDMTNYHPDGCDSCGAIADLYHNEATGLAFCDDCDTANADNSTEDAVLLREAVARGVEAVRALHNDYNDARRAASLAAYGHTGAAMATVPLPTLEDEVRAVLAVANPPKGA